MPDEANMKFVPKAYRCPELGTIYLKYKGVRELVEQVNLLHTIITLSNFFC